ncbi:MAG: hypothetical protein AAGA57_00200 [Planctomycetota bacterium]
MRSDRNRGLDRRDRVFGRVGVMTSVGHHQHAVVDVFQQEPAELAHA